MTRRRASSAAGRAARHLRRWDQLERDRRREAAMGRHAAAEPAPIERPPVRQRLPLIETFVFAPVVAAVAAVLMHLGGASWDTAWSIAVGIAVVIVLAGWLTRSTPGQLPGTGVNHSQAEDEGPTHGRKPTP
jgi:hypothetical protein